MKVKIFIFFSAWLLMSYSTQEQDDQIDISAIELVDLEGNSVDWDGLKGKIVVLNFWATWCKPCIMEMPSMDRAYQTLKDENFVFLAASYEAPEKIKRFVEKQSFSFSFVHMKASLEDLNIYSIPTTFIINREGELVKTVVGSREWNAQDTLNELKKIN